MGKFKSFLYLFLILILSFNFISCSNNSKSNVVVQEETLEYPKNYVAAAGILVPSNYIELSRQSNDETLYYDLSAKILPFDATIKDLVYSVEVLNKKENTPIINQNNTKENVNNGSNEDLNGNLNDEESPFNFHVDETGKIITNLDGEFVIHIKSKESENINQKVKVIVSQKKFTPLTNNNNISIFGKYIVDQYKVDYGKFSNLAVNTSSFEINLERDVENENSVKIHTNLLFNGLNIDLLPKHITSFTNSSYEEIADFIIEKANIEFLNENKLIVALKGSIFTNLVDADVIKEDQTLYLSMKKIEDLNPGQVGEIEDHIISPTGIEIYNPASLEISHDAATSRSITLNAMITPINATNRGLVFKSLNPDVATISNFGKIKIVGVGKADIEVSSVLNSDIKKVLKLNLTDTSEKVQNVDFVQESINKNILNVNDIFTFAATASPENATFKDVEFYTPNSDILRIHPNGSAKALKPGVAFVYAFSTDDITKRKNIEVLVRKDIEADITEVKGISGVVDKIILKKDELYQIDPEIVPSTAIDKRIQFHTSSSNISINSNGYVRGISAGLGTVTIRSLSRPNIEKIVEVEVIEPKPSDIYINKINLSEQPKVVYVNNTQIPDLVVTTEPSFDKVNQMKVIEATSDNVAVIKVTQVNKENKWKVEAIGEGKATVLVTSENGKFAKVTYEVFKPMNIIGEYEITGVTVNDGFNTLNLTKGGSNFSQFEGEFSFHEDNNRILGAGRYQYTPKDLSEISNPFYNKRYGFGSFEIRKNPSDPLRAKVKSNFIDKNIEFVSEKELKYVFNEQDRITGKSYTTTFSMVKKTDNNVVTENKQLYVSPIKINDDLKFINGNYNYNFVYQKSFPAPALFFTVNYKPIFSGNCNDKDTLKSFFRINYGRCDHSLGGNGPRGNVTNYKGELAINSTVKGNSAEIKVYIKDQKQGHNTYNSNGLNNHYPDHLKYSYLNFKPFTINIEEFKKSGMYSNNSLNVDVLMGNGGRHNRNAKFYMKIADDKTIDVEVSVPGIYVSSGNVSLDIYYKFEKRSNIFNALTESKYADDVSDTKPPVLESFMQVKPLSKKEGNATNIY